VGLFSPAAGCMLAYCSTITLFGSRSDGLGGLQSPGRVLGPSGAAHAPAQFIFQGRA
jgi:hypothetical protein